MDLYIYTLRIGVCKYVFVHDKMYVYINIYIKDEKLPKYNINMGRNIHKISRYK